METYSEAAWTDSLRFGPRNTIQDSLSILDNTEHQEESIFIDVVEEPKRVTREFSPPGRNEEIRYLVKRNNVPPDNAPGKSPTRPPENRSGTNCDLTQEATSSHTDDMDGTNRPNDAIINDSFSLGDSDADIEDEDDDIDDDEDEEDDDCSLVVNLELPEDRSLKNSDSVKEPLSLSAVTKPAPTSTVLPHIFAEPLPRTSPGTALCDQGKTQLDQEEEPRSKTSDDFHKFPDPPCKKTTPCGTVGASLRALPIHVVIEQHQTSALEGDHIGSCLLDSYAILPGATLFSNIVQASLSKLGFNGSETLGAQGGIQLKHWKTLTFEAITENNEATVEEILGEVTSVATLKIHLSSPVNSDPSSHEVRDQLAQLVLTKSIEELIQAGCPVDKPTLEAISAGRIHQNISEQLCASLNDWLAKQTSTMPSKSDKTTPEKDPVVAPSSEQQLKTEPDSASSIVSPHSESNDKTISEIVAAPKCTSQQKVDLPLNLEIKQESEESQGTKLPSLDQRLESQKIHPQHFKVFHSPKDANLPTFNKKNTKLFDKHCSQTELYKLAKGQTEGNIPSTLQNHPPNNPYLGLIPGKTRIRTSFDPEHEIPRLQTWFGANQHPTRDQMLRFMHELNGLESRKGRRPLDLTNIIYWFKNARAAQRRATRILDDSFENDANLEINSCESGNSTSDSATPYLPNKNAIYMIPFNPYSHLVPPATGNCADKGISTGGADIDEPYDLSLTKRTHSDLLKTPLKTDINLIPSSPTPSPTKSSPTSSERDLQGNVMKRKKLFCPPKFPALLDVASKMHQEIPLCHDDIFFSSNTINNINNQNGCRISPYRSGSSDLEQHCKKSDNNNIYSSPSTPLQNGDSPMEKFSGSLQIKHEESEFLNHQSCRKSYLNPGIPSRDALRDLGPVKIEKETRIDLSDEDEEDANSQDSFDSEEEFRLRMKHNAGAAAAAADYASAMHNNVSRLTAANMAALSLAQMGQPLHIPQLTSSLAMAYYPMDPRFYSQPSLQHSLSASPPASLPPTHSSHLSQMSLRQTQECNPRLDSRSPLPSPALIQHSLTQLSHHHHHQQQHSPQPPHPRHSSEPRKRRTRVFIDPLTEIPKLEKWFLEDTHPSAFMIDKYCEDLNKCEYRHKFPKLEPKNVQLWFKNHRAKVKRMKVSSDEQTPHNGTDGQEDDMDS